MKSKTIRQLHNYRVERNEIRISLRVIIFTLILLFIAIYSCFAV